MFLMRNDTPQYKTLFPDLRGKLVYTQRENDISVLYTLDLQTEEARRVYSHDDPYNANILFPKWSEDASRIQFIAMHDKEWNVYSVRPDGTNLRLEGPAQNGNELLSRVSRTDDIVGKKAVCITSMPMARKHVSTSTNTLIKSSILAPQKLHGV